MAGQLPEEVVKCPVMLQGWHYMTFLHWAYPPDVVEPFLPTGFRPHLWDGLAWVSLTPFLIENARPPLVPSVPRLSTFPETNLRSYAVAPDGQGALWLFTLEAANLATVLGARAASGVPYRWADMTVEVADRITYRSTRRPPHRRAGHHVVVEPGEPLGSDVSEHDHWLTGRWRAAASVAGRPAYVAVAHPPWPLHRATVHRLDENLLADAGLPPPGGEPLVHYSPGVDVRLGPRAVGEPPPPA